MKISFPKDYKHVFTLAEYEAAKEVKSEYKNYDFKEDAQIALNHYQSKDSESRRFSSFRNAEIIKLEAEVVKDCLVDYNALCDFSGSMNIWLKITAFSSVNGFIILEIPITDIWNMGDENADFSRAYIREYKVID